MDRRIGSLDSITARGAVASMTYSDVYISDVLGDVKSIAIVGASPSTDRPSYAVMKYMLANGYDVVPINPTAQGAEILGQKVVGSLSDLDRPIDMIDIFRNSEAALDVTREAIRLKRALGLKAIWMQLMVFNQEAADEAELAGLRVVMNRCPKIEHRRLLVARAKRGPTSAQASEPYIHPVRCAR